MEGDVPVQADGLRKRPDFGAEVFATGTTLMSSRSSASR